MAAKKKTTEAVAAKAKPMAKKTAVKKVAVKKPVAKKAGVKKAVTSHHGGLHYDKEALLREYDGTYDMFMKALAFIIGGVLIYFFVFVVYLGGTSHTKHAPFVEKFGDRIDYSGEYEGLKLPIYGTDE